MENKEFTADLIGAIIETCLLQQMHIDAIYKFIIEIMPEFNINHEKAKVLLENHQLEQLRSIDYFTNTGPIARVIKKYSSENHIDLKTFLKNYGIDFSDN